MRLFTKILLFFISLVVMLSMATTYFGIGSVEQIAVKELERELTSDTNLLTLALDREISQVETSLTVVAMRDGFKKAFRDQDLQTLQALMADMLHQSDINILRCTNDKGKELVMLTKKVKGARFVSPEIPVRTTENGFAIIESGGVKKVALRVSIALNDRHRFRGNLTGFVVVGNSAFMNNIAQILAHKRDEPVFISIFQKEKRVFTTFIDRPGETSVQNYPPQISDLLYNKGRVYIGRMSAGKTSYYTIYTPAKYDRQNKEWSYGIAINENIFFPYKKRLLHMFITFSGLATLAVIAIAFLVTRGINPSLGKIINICGKIEKGDMQSRIDEKEIRLSEFSLIASAVNKMIDRVTERETIIEENMAAISRINAELEEKSKIIREDRKRFLSILETMQDGLMTINNDGVVTYFNSAARKITGIDSGSVVGGDYRNIFAALEIGEKNGTIPEEIVLKNGSSMLYLRLTISPFVLETEEQGYIILFRDVSEEKKMEEFKADFVSSINHDIKSFLTPVLGFLKRILREKYGPLHEPLREKVVSIQENISKIYHLVENYLNISTIESGKLEIVPQPANLPEIISSIVRLYGSRVRYVGDSAMPPVLADTSYIERAIANLIVNALKFSPDQTLINVSTREEGNMVITAVQDEGLGIPQGEIPYIFDKYRRGSFGRQEKGSGLGLFIVKSIIEAHGGTVWVESVVQKGTIFLFSLPLAGTIPDYKK